jgi:hypothetical protein
VATPSCPYVGEDLGGPGDDGKDIVEVVSDTAGEVTDRIELLGLAQLLLQRDAFRHVAADEEIALLQLEPAQGERHDPAVTVHIAAVDVHYRLTFSELTPRNVRRG